MLFTCRSHPLNIVSRRPDKNEKRGNACAFVGLTQSFGQFQQRFGTSTRAKNVQRTHFCKADFSFFKETRGLCAILQQNAKVLGSDPWRRSEAREFVRTTSTGPNEDGIIEKKDHATFKVWFSFLRACGE